MDEEEVRKTLPLGPLGMDIVVNKAIELIKDNATAESVEEQAEEAPKKKATRKKKTEETADAAEEAAEEAPKKKTTRKKKIEESAEEEK